MTSQMGKWALAGVLIGILCVSAGLIYLHFNIPVYSDEQKLEINHGLAVNCTRCLQEQNMTCTAETITHSPWGVVCKDKYVDECKVMCRVV
jgi:hypothetical protein